MVLLVTAVAVGLAALSHAVFVATGTLLKAAGLGLGAAGMLTPLLAARPFRSRTSGASAALAELRQGIQRIGSGEWDASLPVDEGTELGQLAAAINGLAAQLQASRSLAEAREQVVIDTLGQVVEGRSHETANHMARVGSMSCELALLAGLPREEAELLRLAAPLHDLGKVGIPDAILRKPGKFTPEEYAIMKTHAVLGHRILSRSERPVLKAAAIIALSHHERWDGYGYPSRLAGEQIPIFGRIVGLIDVFDAMFSHRDYREAMPLEKGIGIIKTQRGHHFDPRLIDLFLANLPRFLAIMEKYKDAERTGDNEAPARAAADEFEECSEVVEGAEFDDNVPVSVD